MSTNKNNSVRINPITPRSEDFSQWYLDVIREADLFEYAPIKGCIVFKPYGYAIWENIQDVLDHKFKDTGVENAYFPLLIPERFLKREKEHVEGFSPEVAAVMYAGGERLKEALIVRPTSESIIYPIIAGWIKSHRDLPLLLNQWVNVVRWEKRPRPFIRTTEFLWQEGHTAHASESEADERARLMLSVYKDFAEDFMAIPVITGIKSESEKFAGALRTYTVEAMMQDGKSLQFSTSHNLGQNFSKAFGIEFTDQDGSSGYCWQTSWGLSTRTIGALVMVHGDDKGLVLSPNIAPVKLAIVPIWGDESKPAIKKKVLEIISALKDFGISEVKFDDREEVNPGDKYYFWERKGVPLRIEIGPKDLQKESVVLVRRDTGEKFDTEIKNVAEVVKSTLVDIQKNLYQQASNRLSDNTVSVDNWDNFKSAINNKKFVLAHWCGDAKVEDKIKKETKATIRCIPLDQPEEEGRCVLTGKPSKRRVLFAQSY